MSTARIEARRAATQAAILKAAWELAQEGGLGSIGMRGLAGKLGMAASSLYEYFPGKDAIYDEMFRQGNLELRARFEGLQASNYVSAREALIAGAEGFIRFCEEDHARFRLLFQHAIPGWRPSAEAYAAAIENLEAMREFLASIDITDDKSADLWTAINSGLAGQQVANDPGGDRWLGLVPRAVDMYLMMRGDHK